MPKWLLFSHNYQLRMHPTKMCHLLNTRKFNVICNQIYVTLYRESPVSAVFWSPANRTIAKTALIEHWFSTKIAIWDFWVFKVHFFHLLRKIFTRKTLVFIAFTVGQFPLVQISNLELLFLTKNSSFFIISAGISTFLVLIKKNFWNFFFQLFFFQVFLKLCWFFS